MEMPISRTPDNWNQKWFPSFSQTLQFYPRFIEPIFVSFGGSRIRVLDFCRVVALSLLDLFYPCQYISERDLLNLHCAVK